MVKYVFINILQAILPSLTFIKNDFIPINSIQHTPTTAKVTRNGSVSGKNDIMAENCGIVNSFVLTMVFVYFHSPWYQMSLQYLCQQ
jgi:hypothetical protein